MLDEVVRQFVQGGLVCVGGSAGQDMDVNDHEG